MRSTVSIVIPCFNHAKYLYSSLESALQQTIPPLEIIVIDDGSTDDTKSVATSFPNVKYYFQNNSGLSSARNTGIKKAQGDFILFNDADDTLPKTALEYHLKCYSANPDCILISGPNIRIDESGEPLPYKILPDGPVTNDSYESLLIKNYIGMPGTALVKRDALMAVGGYDESLDSCEDFDIYLKLAKNNQFGYHTNVSGHYRTSTNSMSSDSIKMLKRSVKVFHRQSPFI